MNEVILVSLHVHAISLKDLATISQREIDKGQSTVPLYSGVREKWYTPHQMDEEGRVTFKSAATPVKEASRREAEGSIAASLTIVRLLVGWLKSFLVLRGRRERKEVLSKWYMWIIKECEGLEGRRGAGGERGWGVRRGNRKTRLSGQSKWAVAARVFPTTCKSEMHHQGQLGSSEAVRS